MELLKHAYILKVGAGCISQATELETYLDEFIDNGLEPDSVAYSALQFLNGLKSLESEEDSSLVSQKTISRLFVNVVRKRF